MVPMRVLSTALLLAGSFTAARLSLKDTIRAVKRSVCATSDGKELRINPEGPLNVLRAHALVGNNIIANKRLFSAPATVDYKLARNKADDAYVYEKAPEEGPIRNLPGADPEAMAYLRAYHETLRIMFRAVEGTVYVSSAHHKSFYKYLSVLPGDDKRAHFLAMLLVLAEVGRGVVKVDVHREDTATKAKKLNKKPASIDFTCQRTGQVLLNLPLEAPGKNWKPNYAENALAVVDFFATHGGTDVQKAYGLEHYSDSPGSLILAYSYEYARSHEFVGRIFRHVDAILRLAYVADELAAVHGRFFTGGEIGPEYSRAYGALERIREIDRRGVFPFSRTKLPPDNQLVYLYDEASQSMCSATSYSDCTEIALYNLFCCLLFDPKTRKRSLKHLRARGCAPTKLFESFFARESAEPDSDSWLGVHQEWARVAQGLTLFLDDENNPHAAANGSSLITYKRGDAGSTGVELKGNLGNFLMALATIAGLPDEVTRELHGLLPSSGSPIDCDRISASIARALNCISLMCVDARHSVFYAADSLLYGTLELSFQPQKRGTAAPPQTVVLKFVPGHASFAHKLDSIVLSAEERQFFEAYGEAGADGGRRPLLGLVDESVRRLLSAADGTFLPNAHIGRVEAADDSIACHNALTGWMARAEMQSPGDLLAALDELSPALATFVQRNTAVLGQTRKLKAELDDPSTDSDRKARVAEQLKDAQDRVVGSPLVILVANILGRMPLTDGHTRRLFFELLMRPHARTRDILFPQLEIPRNAYPQFDQGVSLDSPEHAFDILIRYKVPNTLAGYLKLRDMAGCEPVDPERVYPETVKYIQHYLAYPHPHCQEFVTLVRYCDEGALKIMKENYIFSTCEPGSAQYCLLAACWAYMALSVGRYEEVYQICDTWKVVECRSSKDGVPKRSRGLGDYRPLSTRTVERVFPNGPTGPQLKALLRVFAFFARTDAMYDGIYEVFVAYRGILGSLFAAGYCAALASSYGESYSYFHAGSKKHCRIFCKDLPLGPLCAFVAKLKALYFRGAGAEHENLFVGVEEQLRDVEAYLKEILDGSA
ncbi:hypothetical protein PAPHI01_0122 [Pancytospora philotis]|nr:hypothetical protein PAPHI01_0122 [Pancytospora philotis]